MTDVATPKHKPRRGRQTLGIGALVVLAVVGGMVAWGINVHKHAPRWAPGQAMSLEDGRSVLRQAIAGLHTAKLDASVQGEVGLQVQAAVNLRSRPLSAQLATQPLGGAGGKRYSMVVRGGTVYIHLPDKRWASTPVRADAKGFVPTLLSQLSGGIDLRHLFRGAEQGLRSATYVGPFTDAALGVGGDRFKMTVSAWSVRELLPSLLTQKSDHIRRSVPVTLYVDHQGRLLRFSTVMNKDAVTVEVAQRNQNVTVKPPHGTIVALDQLTGGVQITASQAVSEVQAAS